MAVLAVDGLRGRVIKKSLDWDHTDDLAERG